MRAWLLCLLVSLLCVPVALFFSATYKTDSHLAWSVLFWLFAVVFLWLSGFFQGFMTGHKLDRSYYKHGER